MNVLVDECTNIKQQTWTVGPFQELIFSVVCVFRLTNVIPEKIIFISRGITVLSSHKHLRLPSGLLPSVSPPQCCMHLYFPPIHATFPSNLIIFYLITQMIFGEEYRAQISMLCILLHSPIILCHLVWIIFLSILYLNTVSICLYLKWKGKASHPYKQVKLQFCVSLYFCIANWKAENSAPNDSKHSLIPGCC